MKTFAKIAVLALFTLSITTIGCKKYEDGPAISLLTKKQRIVGSWKVDKLFKNGADNTSDYRQGILSERVEFKKDETYNATYTNNIVITTATTVDNGTWKFANDKEQVSVTVVDGNNSETTAYTILRLANKELWLSYVDGSDTYEIRYIPN